MQLLRSLHRKEYPATSKSADTCRRIGFDDPDNAHYLVSGHDRDAGGHGSAHHAAEKGGILSGPIRKSGPFWIAQNQVLAHQRGWRIGEFLCKLQLQDNLRS